MRIDTRRTNQAPFLDASSSSPPTAQQRSASAPEPGPSPGALALLRGTSDTPAASVVVASRAAGAPLTLSAPERGPGINAPGAAVPGADTPGAPGDVAPGPLQPLANVVTGTFDFTVDVVTGCYDALAGVGHAAKDAVLGVFAGLWCLVRGDFEGAYDNLRRGLTSVVQATFDTPVMLLGKTTSAVQTAFGIEPPGRAPNQDELVELRKVFGDSIDFDRVLIKEGEAGLFTLGSRPFVLGNTIYMKDVQSPDVLVHEMVHVWQHQQGGTDYISGSLFSQALLGTNATYGLEGRVPDTPWSELGVEQQAMFIQRAYSAGAFEHQPPMFPSTQAAFPGVTLSALNAYLASAVERLRSGRGAP